MARLGESAHLATVAIGEGLMYAFDSLSNGTSVKGATSSIVDFGTAIGNAIKGVGDLITKIKSLVYLGPILGPLLKGLAFIINKTNPEILITKGLGQIHASTLAKVAPTDRQVEQQLSLEAAAQKKVLANKAAQLASEKAILATQKAQTLEQKNQALLKILGTTSQDFERANLMAALAHAQTQEVKDQLQYQLDLLDATNQTGAAQAKTIDNAIILKEKMLLANGQVMLVDGSIVNLSDAKNPFAGFDKYVQDALDAILKLDQAILSMPSANYGAISTNTLTDYTLYAQNELQNTPASNSASNGSNTISILLSPGLVVDQTQAATANGTALNINRTTGSFGTGY